MAAVLDVPGMLSPVLAVLRRSLTQCLILGTRAVAPLSCLMVLRYALQVGRSAYRGKVRTQALKAAALNLVKLWGLVEVGFLVYYTRYYQYLNSQSTRRFRALTGLNTEEKRRLSMERYLTSLTQVCGVDGVAKSAGSGVTLGKKKSLKGVEASRSPGMRAALHAVRSFSALSSELTRSSSGIFGALSSSRSFHNTSFQSTEDLLSLWDKGEAEKDFSKFKALEISAWFQGSGVTDAEDPGSWLKRGNVEDWICHYWFRGETPEQCKTYKEEIQALVKMVLEYFEVERIPDGRNPDVWPTRIYTDVLPVQHRPLCVFLATSCLCPLLTEQVMYCCGFLRERVGGLLYWHRPPRSDVSPEVDIAGPDKVPLVFIHGLGIGLVPYYDFIRRLSRSFSGDLYVPELPFLATAPWESVPSPREVVAQIQDMLAANKHASAHFAGHSYGTIVLSWMVKMSPSSVLCTTFMEPAAFLMIKADCLYNALYREPRTCFEMVVRYFCFRELFTVNLICRCYFWELGNCWPEEVRCPAVVELAGTDHLIQSVFIKRLLEHENQARKKQAKEAKKLTANDAGTRSACDVRVDAELRSTPRGRSDGKSIDIFWCEDFFHGEILARQDSQDILFRKMHHMVVSMHRDLHKGAEESQKAFARFRVRTD